MPKTIKQRLVFICCYAHDDIDDVENTTTFREIIEEWKAAINVMKNVLSKSFYQLGHDIICENCRKHAETSIDIVHDSDCSVGALLKLIAKMEGNSPSRDEAMVEDKRYERDDIFKK